MEYCAYKDKKEFYVDKTYDIFSEFEIDGDFTKEGIKKNIDLWYENKSTLMELLRRHPNWDEENKAITINITEERQYDSDFVVDKLTTLYNYITIILSKRIKSKELSVGLDDSKFRIRNVKIENRIYTILKKLTSGTNISNDTSEFLKNSYSYDVAVGAKASREINKIFKKFPIEVTYIDFESEDVKYRYKKIEIDATTISSKPYIIDSKELLDEFVPPYTDIYAAVKADEEDLYNFYYYDVSAKKWRYDYCDHVSRIRTERRYEKLFAELSDALNPKSIEKKLLLSVNFLDFMLMSNGNSWLSCHFINSHNIFHSSENRSWSGMYKGGCLSYANDKTTMILYTIPKDCEKEYYHQPKINRQLFHFNDGTLCQARLYPSNDSTNVGLQYMSIVQKIISECMGLENEWDNVDTNLYGRILCSSASGLHYHDYADFRKIVRIKNYECAETICIGSVAYCVDCGRVLISEKNLQCESCINDSHHVCSVCGAVCSTYEISLDGNIICENCRDEKYIFSKFNNAYILKEKAIYVPSEDDYVSPLTLFSYFNYCHECGQIHNSSKMERDADGNKICISCVELYYETCAKCNNIHKIKDIKLDKITERKYCKSCMGKVNENRKYLRDWLKGKNKNVSSYELSRVAGGSI